MEIITPLLLVIDELTMNAIKHAFPDENQENKKIYKKIDYLDENTCELILKDNGVGIESPEKLINHNLGWEIVMSLSRQINGKLEVLEVDEGTGFRLTFPMNFQQGIN
jgi:two-component sensor histidine kinase